MNGRPVEVASARPWLGETWKSMRFFQLFVFTVLVLLLFPLQLRFRILWLMLTVLYLAAVFAATAGRQPMLRWAFLSGWIVVLVLKLAPIADPPLATVSYVISRIVVVVLLGGCVAATLDYVLRGIDVSADRIFAAIVAYMLTGLGFAAAYQAIVAVVPDSFALPTVAGAAAGDSELLEVQLIYFSFVTIATLGYGDIAPRLPLPQMLVVVEAVTGQFYLAVVIAWLVSAYATHRKGGG